MLKTDLQAIEDEAGCRFYVTNVGQGNNDLETEPSGMIPFETTYEGLSPGQFIMDWKKKLAPDCEFLFQRPRKISRTFKMEDNPLIW